ncbi:hypothetical protein Tco_1050748 [Tanacetum coccineum]
MGTNVTSSSGSVLEEPEIQKLQMQAKIFKENSLNKLNALKSTTQLLRLSIISTRFCTTLWLWCLLKITLQAPFLNVQRRLIAADQALVFMSGLVLYQYHGSSKMFELSGDETSSGIVLEEEIDKKELEAHYGFMAKIQEVLPEESSSTEQPLEQILQTKLNETLGLLALKDIEIKEGLKTKAYEISVLNQKHDELVKKSLLTKSQLEGYLKENTKVILDLKVKEDKDIDKMIEMEQ